MKEFIIAIFSPLLQLNVLLSTIGGFVAGGIIGGGVTAMFGEPSFNYTTALIFAVLAFANSAIISGAGLVLDRMRELMEEQVNLTRREQAEQRTSRASAPAGAATPGEAASRVPVASAASGRSYDVRKILLCPQCGAQNRNDRAFCYRCELPLEGVEEQAAT